MATILSFPKIRILSEKHNDLRIIDLSTGEEILKGCVRRAIWTLEAGKVPVAHLELVAPAVEVVGVLPEITVPGLPVPEGGAE
jgi:hypothetical protein